MKKKLFVTLISLLAQPGGFLECFHKSESLLPKPLVGKSGSSPLASTEMQYRAIVAGKTGNFIVYGGRNSLSSLNYESSTT